MPYAQPILFFSAVLTASTMSPHEKDRFIEEIKTLWKPLVPTTFTNDDEKAREAIQEFYASGGWVQADVRSRPRDHEME